MSFNSSQAMDSLCEAFEKLTIRGDTIDFSSLPKELQLTVWQQAIAEPVVHDVNWQLFHLRKPKIPEVLSGVNWLCHSEAKKNYRRLTHDYMPAMFFNPQQDSVLFENYHQLVEVYYSISNQVVNSMQSSARICDIRPPLVDVDRHLELDNGDEYIFPLRHLQTFIVQDLQCSRKHRLQDITERVLCKEGLRRFFVKQKRRYRTVEIPEIIIRVPRQGSQLCYECKKLDEWLAMPESSRHDTTVSIIDRNQYT